MTFSASIRRLLASATAFRPQARRRTALLPWIIEHCEERVLLAGNVLASVTNGTLTLKGDLSNNSVQVEVKGGNVVVSGLDGTTINGQASFIAVTGATQLSGDLIADLGAGHDKLVLSDHLTVKGSVLIEDAVGNTTVGLNSVTVEKDLTIQTSAGTDSVSLEEVTIGGRARIHTGGAADLVALLKVEVAGSTQITTGGGSDGISLDECEFSGSVELRTASGDDTVHVRESTVAGRFEMWAGTGNDFVMFEDSTVSGQTRILLEKGNDSFIAEGTTRFSKRAVILGMAGRRDAFDLSGETTFVRGRVLSSFRKRTVADSLINSKLNAANTGLLTRADALRTAIGETAEPFSLTAGVTSTEETTAGTGTTITRLSQIEISGVTSPGATVTVDSDSDGQYDDVSVVADADGKYSFEIPVNVGAQVIKVKATNTDGETTTKEVNVHRAVGSVVEMVTSLGKFQVELYDTEAPLTVANFKSYLTDYVNSIIHRSTKTSTEGLTVIQGGGFVLDGTELEQVTPKAPVVNEFAPINSNLRGKLALALPANNIDGGTSQWFINVTDNAGIDTGSYTVFGEVVGTGMTIVDAISALGTMNLNSMYSSSGSALGTVPVRNYVGFTQPITGVLDVDVNSTMVNGTGTSFTTQLSVGSRIQIGNHVSMVTQIVSDTQLVLAAAPTTTISDAAARTDAKPTADQLVVFSGINEILPLA
ncbi:peptidylprolyl isomerase [Planctomicrobium sp. SH664]|uniref:peptidylprolyl isomerase n=1 Tax=Planctomicrobium sp. SH664 TaxID=3448125 RepID=UPI003F5C34CD